MKTNKKKNFKSSKVLQPEITTVDIGLYYFVVKNSFSHQCLFMPSKKINSKHRFLHCHILNFQYIF